MVSFAIIQQNFIKKGVLDETNSFKEFIQYSNDTKQFIQYFENRVYYVRTGGLNDKIIYSEEEINKGAVSDIYDTEVETEVKNKDRLIFKNGEFSKEILFNENGFDVRYILPKNSEKLTVKTEIMPDYYTIFNNGKNSLNIEKRPASIDCLIIRECLNSGYGLTLVELKNI